MIAPHHRRHVWGNLFDSLCFSIYDQINEEILLFLLISIGKLECVDGKCRQTAVINQNSIV